MVLMSFFNFLISEFYCIVFICDTGREPESWPAALVPDDADPGRHLVSAAHRRPRCRRALVLQQGQGCEWWISSIYWAWGHIHKASEVKLGLFREQENLQKLK